MKALCIMEDPVIMDIDIMEDAHTALQAMAGTPCAELVETYHWMWEKYKTCLLYTSHHGNGNQIRGGDASVNFRNQGYQPRDDADYGHAESGVL